jgi:aspartyl-tRNA(Asn)/glutamyl-tRNA(Gln) amidotransferase subunit B
VRQLGVSDVNMDEGSLRCDANVSIRPAGSPELGVKTELKNMNSFRFVKQGIEAEIARQTALVEQGEAVTPQTLHFDTVSGSITSLRSKEGAHDYRYFPEPDLLPVKVTQAMIDAACAALPELPAQRAERYESEHGLNSDLARQLAFRSELGDYFEAALAAGDGVDASALANWVGGELVARIGDADPGRSRVEPAALARLVTLLGERKVTQGAAKRVLDTLVAEGGDPRAIVESQGLGAMGAGDELATLVSAAIEANPAAVEKIRAGKAQAIGAIVGHVMRESKGRADGGEVQRLIRDQLEL